MDLSKREFMQVMGAASVAGLSLAQHAEADAATAAQGLYDLPRFGQVSFLHMTDCHAQLLPVQLSRAQREPGRGRHEGPSASPGGRAPAQSRGPAPRNASGACTHLPRL